MTQPTASSKGCSPAPAPRCRTRSGWPGDSPARRSGCPRRQDRSHRADRAGQPLPDRLEDVTGEPEILKRKHVRTPILAGEVWYHSWQGGAGYGDPIGREPASVARDVGAARCPRSGPRRLWRRAERGWDAGARRDGARAGSDAPGAPRRREGPRRLRCSAHVRRRRFASLGDAFALALDERRIACARCDEVLGAPGDNLLARLRERVHPGPPPARPRQDRDRRRGLRLLVCPGCGATVDARLALDGAPRPSMRIVYR